MRDRHLLVANWKMNLGPAQTKAYCQELRAHATPLKQTDVWIAPPLVSLAAATECLAGSSISVGAQNVHRQEAGAFTGETSPRFIAELGCSFAIVGHSERRHLFAESSELVAQRTQGALSAGLTAIVCIGEREEERIAGETEQVLRSQLTPVLSNLSTETEVASRIVIAYEPVWAIGTGKVATVAEIAHAHHFIGRVWQEHGFGGSPATLYGGSVNPGNFAAILSLGDVDGALVGGASLKFDQWSQLIAVAESTPITA